MEQAPQEPKASLQIDIDFGQNVPVVKSISIPNCVQSKPFHREDAKECIRQRLDSFFLSVARCAFMANGVHPVMVSHHTEDPLHGIAPKKLWGELNRQLERNWRRLLGFRKLDSMESTIYQWDTCLDFDFEAKSNGDCNGAYCRTPLNCLFELLDGNRVLQSRRLGTPPVIVRAFVGNDPVEFTDEHLSILNGPAVDTVSDASAPSIPNEQNVDTDAIRVYSELGDWIQKNAKPKEPAVLFLYSTFNTRSIIERLLQAKSKITLYIIDPSTINSDRTMARYMHGSLFKTDLPVWAANGALNGGDITVHTYHADDAHFEGVLVGKEALVTCKYRKAKDANGHRRRWSHDSTHSSLRKGDRSFAKEISIFEEHIEELETLDKITTLDSYRSNPNERGKVIKALNLNENGV